MNIQIFGSKKNNDSKKAERWFKERRIRYQYIDLYEKGLSLGDTAASRKRWALRHWWTLSAAPTRTWACNMCRPRG